MNIDIYRLDDLLRQADRWIKEGAKPTEMKLKLHWDGRPEEFAVDYDEDSVGLLTLAIASDPVLAAAAWAALLKVISEYGDLRMGLTLREFTDACTEIHRDMEAEGICDAEYPLVFAGRDSGN